MQPPQKRYPAVQLAGKRMEFDQLKRREFITLISGAALAWPFTGWAQQTMTLVAGFLNSASAEGYASMAAAFRQGLNAALQYVAKGHIRAHAASC